MPSRRWADKSQLAALAFATRFSARLTLAGSAAATLVVHLFSVILGQAVGMALPTLWIRMAAGLAELGDKTMLATATLGSRTNAFIGVWLGSTVGMVAADALAILVGRALGTRLPERAIRIGAAAIFFGFGLWILAEAVGPVG